MKLQDDLSTERTVLMGEWPVQSVMNDGSASTRPLKVLTATIVAVWFFVALGASVLGVFDSRQGLPIPLGVAAVLPVLAFAIWRAASVEFRRFVRDIDLRLLTLAQAWRIGGIVFLILYSRGILPGVFALPAGWGDVAIGATALSVARSIPLRYRFQKHLFILWNLLGLFDLVMAVTLGILASAGSLGVLAGTATTQVMGTFPLSVIPTFFVPLMIIFHWIALERVWTNTEESATQAVR